LNIDWEYKFGFLLFLLILSAFFAGSEVALFSLDKKKLQSTFESNPLIRRYLQYLLDSPGRLLVSLLIGNTLVNVAASIIAVTLALDYSHKTGIPQNAVLTIEIIILTLLILFAGELLPKILAAKHPNKFSKAVAIPLYWFNVILFPVAEILTEAIKSGVRRLKMDKLKGAILPEEIAELAKLSHERGTIIEEEHGLIHSIVNFRGVAVHEVMTPRVDMVAISVESTFNELLDLITKTGNSRIPVYREDLDEIIGIIYAKDILPFLRNEEKRKNFSLAKIAHKALFIPGSKLISSLMHEFQEKKKHLAIVVDEYGGTAGLITLEDIIEEILGEIRDEYDKEENPITKLGDNSYIALGKLTIAELNEFLDTSFKESENYETLAGMVLNHAGQIPKEGYTFSEDDYKLTVKEVLNKRINKVQIDKIKTE
jgi:CBS domain containing-hemolysin-like protein